MSGVVLTGMGCGLLPTGILNSLGCTSHPMPGVIVL